ncbi:hypothetical protein MKZ08_10515 [Viridibacillus sp. FSL R5-0477]|uniref:hypothetical protein n=1 Tax=Viridibacillus TaxID=496496 RepID=UPI0004BA79DA|nr:MULTISPECIES: hypothetical protein [Viridibacillus]
MQENEAEWKLEYGMKQHAIDEKAEELDVKGLYRMNLNSTKGHHCLVTLVENDQNIF